MSVILSGSAFQWPAGEPDTLSSLLLSRVEQNQDSRYIEISHAGERTSQTTAELYREALEILPQLRKHASAGQSDIVVCFESVIDFIPAAWACICGGYSWIPWHLPKLSRDGDISSRLQVLDRKLNDPILLATDRIMARIASLGVWPRAVLSVDRHLRQQIDATSSAQEAPPRQAIDAAILVLTSGTTGTPKIAMLGYRSVLSRFFSRPEPLAGRSRIVCFPIDGVTGLWLIFPGPADMIYIQPDRLAAQPLELLKIIDEFAVKAVSLSTSIAARTYDATQNLPDRYDLSSLDNIGLGGEMIVPNIILRFGRKLHELGAHNLKIALGYGMTETGPLCQTQPMTLEGLADYLPADANPVCVGSPVAGWSLRVVDDKGSALPAGTAGSIEVWSETKLFSGYRNDADLTQASFAADGWFKTGDVGIATTDGLTVTGRQKALIIVNARNIALESIEAPVRQLDGIWGSSLAAAPVRLRDSVTDELAVFFVPRSEDVVDDLCRSIVREIARHSGVTVRHLVPIKCEDFPVTPTGKVMRDVLVELYQSGMLAPHKLSPGGIADVGHRLTESQRWLTALWRRVLELDRDPSLHENFFELGGDSLASAELIFAAEEKFSCELPLEAFFEQPTIATLDALVTKISPLPIASRLPEGRHLLLHKLQSFSGSWRGDRLFSDSLLIGFNTDGYRVPIFWILQDYQEAALLAKYLGPDQPFYAMRSCVGIIKAKDYTVDVLDTVSDRYLWEMLALRVEPTLVLGGTCQGGILALWIARRLKQIGRTPALLALLEWSYSYGSYAEPTLLVYGEESYTAQIYQHPETSRIKWREDFPRSMVASIPGKHGELEGSDECIACLVKMLNERVGPVLAGRLAQSTAKIEELEAKLALSEAKGEVKRLRVALKARAMRERSAQLKASTSWRLTAPLRGLSRGLSSLLARVWSSSS